MMVPAGASQEIIVCNRYTGLLDVIQEWNSCHSDNAWNANSPHVWPSIAFHSKRVSQSKRKEPNRIEVEYENIQPSCLTPRELSSLEVIIHQCSSRKQTCGLMVFEIFASYVCGQLNKHIKEDTVYFNSGMSFKL